MLAPINDSTLLEAKPEEGVVIFLGCIVFTVALLTVGWGALMDRFVRLKTPFCFTTAEYNIADIAKAIHTPKPEIAIVGSSLSKRLVPGFFQKANVTNLSIGGGSVMTGLEILNSSPSLPKIILVEINILDRPVDEEWKDKGMASAKSSPSAILAGVSKPLRYLLVRPLFSYISEEQQTAWWSAKRRDLRSQSVATNDIQPMITAGRVDWDQRNSWDIANQNFKRIQDLIVGLESRGAKLYLLYLPYAAGYDNHVFAQRNREIASGNNAFNCERCIDVRRLVDVEELRWTDGVHLDDRSALIVAEALERRFLH